MKGLTYTIIDHFFSLSNNIYSVIQVGDTNDNEKFNVHFYNPESQPDQPFWLVQCMLEYRRLLEQGIFPLKTRVLDCFLLLVRLPPTFIASPLISFQKFYYRLIKRAFGVCFLQRIISDNKRNTVNIRSWNTTANEWKEIDAEDRPVRPVLSPLSSSDWALSNPLKV